MDFNIKHPTEPDYRDVAIIIDPLSEFKNELLMLLEGKNTDVLGDYDNWIDIESLVFKTNVNEDEIYTRLRNAIESKSVYASEFTWDAKVFFLLDDQTGAEMGVIQIEIYDIINPNRVASNLEFLYRM